MNVRRPRQAPSLALILALAATLAPFTVLAQPASFTSEMVRTTLVEAGQPIDLELVVYRPAGPGPFPALVFNHGSTGDGSDPALFDDTWSNAALADVFRERGWIVFFPQRRSGKRGHVVTCQQGAGSSVEVTSNFWKTHFPLNCSSLGTTEC